MHRPIIAQSWWKNGVLNLLNESSWGWGCCCWGNLIPIHKYITIRHLWLFKKKNNNSKSCLILVPMSVFPKILRKCGGSVELVDVSSELPQLVRRPGVRKWKVCYFCQVLYWSHNRLVTRMLKRFLHSSSGNAAFFFYLIFLAMLLHFHNMMTTPPPPKKKKKNSQTFWCLAYSTRFGCCQ